MIAVGVAVCIAVGDGAAVLSYMLKGADGAVTLSISLAGSYMLWMGVMNIARRAGLIEGLAKLMRVPLGVLLPNAGAALAPVTLNLAANFFGLGNAATPFGLDAMRELQGDSKAKRATDNMCMFIALNASAIELLPTTVIAVRAACGSSDPYSIVLPTFCASLLSAFAAIISCRLLRGVFK